MSLGPIHAVDWMPKVESHPFDRLPPWWHGRDGHATGPLHDLALGIQMGFAAAGRPFYDKKIQRIARTAMRPIDEFPLIGVFHCEAISVPQAIAQDAPRDHQGQKATEEGTWHHRADEAPSGLGQYEAAMEAEGGL